MHITYADDNFIICTNTMAMAHFKDNEDGIYGLKFTGIRQSLSQDISYVCKGSLTLYIYNTLAWLVRSSYLARRNKTYWKWYITVILLA